MESVDSLKEQRERIIIMEQRGIKNSNDITEISMRTKSNTHRIDKLENTIEEVKKDTASLGELKTILKVQAEINVTQTKQMEKSNETLSAITQNLTELKFVTQQLQEGKNQTDKNLEKLVDKIEKEAEENNINVSGLMKKIIIAFFVGIPSLALAWIKFKGGF